MKPAPFAYAKARSVAQAVELLANGDARILAGGQSLIATLNMRLSHPALLIDINGIAGWTASRARTGRSRSAPWSATPRPNARPRSRATRR